MKGSIILTLVVAGIAAYGPASAEEVAPGDVKFEDMKVMASLTGVPGDPEAGRAAMVNRGQGNCLACHAVTALEAELFHGDVAPPLDGVADRWSPEEIRAIVIDAKQVFSEETVMPGFYSLNVGADVAEKFAGKTILTAQQVEDIVAYLSTLKE